MTTTTAPASQAQRRLLARLVGQVYERGDAALAVEMAAAVNDRTLTTERATHLIAGASSTRRRA
jgi:hypothetical protein